MLNFLKRIFKQAEYELCEHEWVTVEYERISELSIKICNEIGYPCRDIAFNGKFNAGNEVCIKCGKCNKELDAAYKYLKEKTIKAKEEYELAKKIYKDNCNA